MGFSDFLSNNFPKLKKELDNSIIKSDVQRDSGVNGLTLSTNKTRHIRGKRIFNGDKIKEITKQETNSETIRFVIDNYLSVLNKNDKSDSEKIGKLMERTETILSHNEIVDKSIDSLVKAINNLHDFIKMITKK